MHVDPRAHSFDTSYAMIFMQYLDDGNRTPRVNTRIISKVGEACKTRRPSAKDAEIKAAAGSFTLSLSTSHALIPIARTAKISPISQPQPNIHT